jgi:hypothetical protein
MTLTSLFGKRNEKAAEKEKEAVVALKSKSQFEEYQKWSQTYEVVDEQEKPSKGGVVGTKRPASSSKAASEPKKRAKTNKSTPGTVQVTLRKRK